VGDGRVIVTGGHSFSHGVTAAVFVSMMGKV